MLSLRLREWIRMFKITWNKKKQKRSGKGLPEANLAKEAKARRNAKIAREQGSLDILRIKAQKLEVMADMSEDSLRIQDAEAEFEDDEPEDSEDLDGDDNAFSPLIAKGVETLTKYLESRGEKDDEPIDKRSPKRVQGDQENVKGSPQGIETIE